MRNIASLVSAIAKNPMTEVLNAADPIAPTVMEIGQAIVKTMATKTVCVGINDPISSKIGRNPRSVPYPFILSDKAAKKRGYKPVSNYYSDLPAS